MPLLPTKRLLSDAFDELTSLPAAPHDDMVNSFTQALNCMRCSGTDWDTSRAAAHQKRMYHDQQRRGVGYGQMTNSVCDADAIEYGASERAGARYAKCKSAWANEGVLAREKCRTYRRY